MLHLHNSNAVFLCWVLSPHPSVIFYSLEQKPQQASESLMIKTINSTFAYNRYSQWCKYYQGTLKSPEWEPGASVGVHLRLSQGN